MREGSAKGLCWAGHTLPPQIRLPRFQSTGALGLLAGEMWEVCLLPLEKDITLVFCLLAHKGQQRSCFHALYAPSLGQGHLESFVAGRQSG